MKLIPLYRIKGLISKFYLSPLFDLKLLLPAMLIGLAGLYFLSLSENSESASQPDKLRSVLLKTFFMSSWSFDFNYRFLFILLNEMRLAVFPKDLSKILLLDLNCLACSSPLIESFFFFRSFLVTSGRHEINISCALIPFHEVIVWTNCRMDWVLKLQAWLFTLRLEW